MVGSYLPNPSPNGRIADAIIQEFAKVYKVTVIATKSQYGQKRHEEISGVSIIRIADHSACLHADLTSRIRGSNGGKAAFWKGLLLCKRVLFTLPRWLRLRSISPVLAARFYHEIKSVLKHSPVDVLIPVSSPHETMVAALKIVQKHKKIEMLPYQLDRFANALSLYDNPLTKAIMTKNNLAFERKLITASKHYFLLFPLMAHYQGKDFFADLLHKMTSTDHPLLRMIAPNTSTFNFANPDQVHVVYAGSLDKTLRNPQYLLEMFLQKQEKIGNIALELFTFGNCGDMIKAYADKLPSTLYDHGKVASQLLEGILKEAQIILTIGNQSDNEVPSKLFEYLSYGKPIVHLYYSDHDAYIGYLKRYPCALLLKMEAKEMDKNAADFIAFVQNTAGKTVPQPEIFTMYEECTAVFVSRMFMEKVG